MSIRPSERDATLIWVARFFKQLDPANPKYKIVRLCHRFGDISEFRLYEIWEEEKFIGSREKAIKLLERFLPDRIKEIDTSPHKKRRKIVMRENNINQLNLF